MRVVKHGLQAFSLKRSRVVAGKLVACLVASLLLLSAAGCSTPPPPRETDLAVSAAQAFEAGHYMLAVEEYGRLLDQHPFSEHAELARLRVAHAFYLGRKYAQAVSAFEDFERRYPASEAIAFSQYITGMCWLDQVSSADRDKSSSVNAILHFDRVVLRYPDSVWATLAGFRKAECYENLADQELHVGDYYRRTGDTTAADLRFHFVLDEYPQTSAAREARERLAGS